jgi:hypothetical protein
MHMATGKTRPQMDSIAAFPDAVTAEVFEGIKTFYRDANLTLAQFLPYAKGMIVYEPGFIDVTHLEGGMGAAVRYCILSAYHAGFRPSFAEFGALTMPKGGYFKIVDKVETQGFLILVLLHISEAALPYFARGCHSQEEEISRICREKIGQWVFAPPHPQLIDVYWLRRTAFPIGIDDDYTPFGTGKFESWSAPTWRTILSNWFCRKPRAG